MSRKIQDLSELQKIIKLKPIYKICIFLFRWKEYRQIARRMTMGEKLTFEERLKGLVAVGKNKKPVWLFRKSLIIFQILI